MKNMEGAIILANALSFLVKIFRKLSRLCSCVIEQGRHTMCSDLQWCFSSDALEYKVNGNMWTDAFVCVILLFFWELYWILHCAANNKRLQDRTLLCVCVCTGFCFGFLCRGITHLHCPASHLEHQSLIPSPTNVNTHTHTQKAKWHAI